MACCLCWSYFSYRKGLSDRWRTGSAARALLLPRLSRRRTPFPSSRRRNCMPLLGLNRVSKKFGGLLAVNQVSFSINEGAVPFIVGPNGGGESTLFNLIAGVFRTSEWHIHFAGNDLSRLSPDRAVHLGIGRPFQIVRPLRNPTVLENTMLGAFL